MNKRIGFIGCGNMGKAMVGSLINHDERIADQMIVSVRTEESKAAILKKWPIKVTLDNTEVALNSDIIFIAVNPNQYEEVIKEIREYVDYNKILISIAAGVKIEQMDEWIGAESKFVLSMPNTPVLVNAGMTAICPNEHVTEYELTEICQLFSVFGEYEIIKEEDFEAFIALCGSSPAYIFVLIEAMADAAVKLGIDRKKAYRMAEQTILGSARLALETGIHPAELKDQVCSPGGATIAAITELESQGFRNSIIKAMEVCVEQSKKMNDEVQ
jgi:pyrroline-5-carboxylate reductase